MRLWAWIWELPIILSSQSIETDLQRSEEHTSELQSPCNLVCRLLLEKKNKRFPQTIGSVQTSRSQRLQKRCSEHHGHPFGASVFVRVARPNHGSIIISVLAVLHEHCI